MELDNADSIDTKSRVRIVEQDLPPPFVYISRLPYPSSLARKAASFSLSWVVRLYLPPDKVVSLPSDWLICTPLPTSEVGPRSSRSAIPGSPR